jgi:hypothetical protein
MFLRVSILILTLLLHRYTEDHAGDSPYDLESLKDFIKNVAFGIDVVEAANGDEEVDIVAAQSTVNK